MYFDGTIQIEESDNCFTCEYFRKSVACPLLEALALNVVVMVDEEAGVNVRNCGFFVEFKRTLKVVE